MPKIRPRKPQTDDNARSLGQITHGDTFHNENHTDIKAGFILANPSFNTADWGGKRLRDDKRWQYGAPPAGNVNFAQMQHIVRHLRPTADFLPANGRMSSNRFGERVIRKSLIEADLVDCMVALPGQFSTKNIFAWTANAIPR